MTNETLVEAADMLHMPATWDWYYDDQGTNLLTMHIGQVMVNAVMKGALLRGCPKLFYCYRTDQFKKPYQICQLSFPSWVLHVQIKIVA